VDALRRRNTIDSRGYKFTND